MWKKKIILSFIICAFLSCSNQQIETENEIDIQATIDSSVKLALENLLPTPTVVPTPTKTPTPTPTPTPTVVPTPTKTPTPTVVPTPTVIPTPTVVPTPTVIPTPTVVPTPTPIPIYPVLDNPWPMVGGNPQHTGQSIFEISRLAEKFSFTNKDKPELFLEYPCGIQTSYPLVSKEGYVYFICEESWNNYSLYALDHMGIFKWKLDLEGNPSDNYPALGKNGNIYLLTQINGTAELHKISSKGENLWKVSGIQMAGTSGGITIFEDQVYSSGNSYSYEGSTLFISERESEVDSYKGAPSIPSDGSIVVLTKNNQDYLSAYSSNGEKIWEVPTTTRGFATIDSDGTIFATGGDQKTGKGNYVFSVSKEGNFLWQTEYFDNNSSVFTNPVLLDDLIIVANNKGKIRAFNKHNKSLEWTFSATYWGRSVPTIDSKQRIIYLNGNSVMTIDKNGNLINSVEIPYNEFGSHIAVGADGAIYFSCGKQFCGIK